MKFYPEKLDPALAGTVLRVVKAAEAAEAGSAVLLGADGAVSDEEAARCEAQINQRLAVALAQEGEPRSRRVCLARDLSDQDGFPPEGVHPDAEVWAGKIAVEVDRAHAFVADRTIRGSVVLEDVVFLPPRAS